MILIWLPEVPSPYLFQLSENTSLVYFSGSLSPMVSNSDMAVWNQGKLNDNRLDIHSFSCWWNSLIQKHQVGPNYNEDSFYCRDVLGIYDIIKSRTNSLDIKWDLFFFCFSWKTFHVNNIWFVNSENYNDWFIYVLRLVNTFFQT